VTACRKPQATAERSVYHIVAVCRSCKTRSVRPCVALQAAPVQGVCMGCTMPGVSLCAVVGLDNVAVCAHAVVQLQPSRQPPQPSRRAGACPGRRSRLHACTHTHVRHGLSTSLKARSAFNSWG
jgi:hypothetical protein